MEPPPGKENWTWKAIVLQKENSLKPVISKSWMAARAPLIDRLIVQRNSILFRLRNSSEKVKKRLPAQVVR
jgi:hypothetical protein